MQARFEQDRRRHAWMRTPQLQMPRSTHSPDARGAVAVDGLLHDLMCHRALAVLPKAALASSLSSSGCVRACVRVFPLLPLAAQRERPAANDTLTRQRRGRSEVGVPALSDSFVRASTRPPFLHSPASPSSSFPSLFPPSPLPRFVSLPAASPATTHLNPRRDRSGLCVGLSRVLLLGA